MSSLSPEQQSAYPAYGNQQAQYQDTGSNPLSLNLGFLKTLTEKRGARDGNPPKRRGPKPDAKPALTRRQELNRQAQRTHRERKELYIKALEDEVLRLKEIFSNISQDKEKLAEENRQLKQILAQNGVPWNGPDGNNPASSQASNLDEAMSTGYTTSSAGGYSQAFTPPLTSQGTAPSVTSSGPRQHPSPHAHHQQPVGYSANTVPNQQMRQTGNQQQSGRKVDMDQAGIDFVLAYGDPSKAYASPPHH